MQKLHHFLNKTKLDVMTKAALARLFEIVSAESVNVVTDFGAKGDGVTDDTAAIQAAFDYVKANGGTLVDPIGLTFKVTYISLTGSAKPWRFQGVRGATKFVRGTNGVNSVFNSTSSAYPFTLQDFIVDAQHSVYSSGNHGISIADMNGLRISGVNVVNYKNSSILVYSTVANAYGDNVLTDCHSDGLGVANNGMLIADCYRSGLVGCTAKGAPGSPGYGIQLKNDARHGFITDCLAENCAAGLAFGQDSGASAVKYATVKGMRVIGCTVGAQFGYAKHNRVELSVDMSSAGENAIDFQDGCVGNSVLATVLNVAALKSAVRTRSGATDNVVQLDYLENINSTGKAASFDSGSERNTVRLIRAVSPNVPATGTHAWVTDNSTAQNNAFVHDAYPQYTSLTIAAGVATVKNVLAESVTMETEAAAATDDLDTITTQAAEGRMLILRTTSNLRDVVVKHNTGNIILVGAVDFTMPTNSSSLTLRYNSAAAKWIETARVSI